MIPLIQPRFGKITDPNPVPKRIIPFVLGPAATAIAAAPDNRTRLALVISTGLATATLLWFRKN
jgi:hypothetical protein